MLNPYTLNIQESLKHAWHLGIGFFRCLAAKVLSKKVCVLPLLTQNFANRSCLFNCKILTCNVCMILTTMPSMFSML